MTAGNSFSIRHKCVCVCTEISCTHSLSLVVCSLFAPSVGIVFRVWTVCEAVFHRQSGSLVNGKAYKTYRCFYSSDS